jgi:NAD(P)H-dependent FMN reductase
MPESPVKLAVIVGSTRASRFGTNVATWFVEHAVGRDDVTVDVIDLAEVRATAPMPGGPGDDESHARATVGPRLVAADAFVVVTPEYNHSYPGSLKSAIDWHRTPWHAKPVGFVSYGGISGGLRAVEHLRQVFAELHAVTVRDTVSFHGVQRQFDSAGRPTDAAACGAAATRLLDRLVWWGRALRAARAERPYAA